MTPLDWLTMALYFGLLTGLTWWSGLTYATITSEQRRESRRSWN